MTASGWRLEVHDELPSTSDEVIRRAEAGSAAGVAVLARRQTKARGSRGRSWSEPPAGNLAVSVLLRPAQGVAESGQAVFRAALALIEALDAHAGAAQLTLKWPNDVLLGGRKLAGILVESAAAGDRLAWMVIGFGANLRARPVLTGAIAACLTDGGGAAARPETVAALLLERIDHWWTQDFAAVRRSWLARAHPVGTTLVVDGRDGLFAGIDEAGALLLDAPDGRRPVATGLVFAPTLAADGHHPT